MRARARVRARAKMDAILSRESYDVILELDK